MQRVKERELLGGGEYDVQLTWVGCRQMPCKPRSDNDEEHAWREECFREWR